MCLVENRCGGGGLYCLAQSVAPCGRCCSWHVNIKGLWEVAIWEYLSGITVFFPSYVIFMSSVIELHIFMSKKRLCEISFLALHALIKSLCQIRFGNVHNMTAGGMGRYRSHICVLRGIF